jgi:transposase InsO family protein
MKVVKRTPNLKAFQRSGENLLLDKAMPNAINQVWVGDITYTKLNNQWRYLATVMDLYSRRIIAWSLSDNRKAELTIRALKLALRKRNYPKGLIFHSDRGIEYLSNEYRNELKQHGIQQSFNRAYHCTDNAFMESFFHSLKGELIRGAHFKNDASLRSELANYINGFYNKTRLHSSINYMSPIEYERRAA